MRGNADLQVFKGNLFSPLTQVEESMYETQEFFMHLPPNDVRLPSSLLLVFWKGTLQSYIVGVKGTEGKGREGKEKDGMPEGIDVE